MVIGPVAFFLIDFTSSVSAVDLPFDPNEYNFLVYNPGSNPSRIGQVMDYLGILNYDPRDSAHPVTLNDLVEHDILIVGENSFGNNNGLHTDDLLAGITGRIVLSGHDADEHIVNGHTQAIKDHAETFLVNAIDYVLKGGGTGILTLGDVVVGGGDTYKAYQYLPEEWGVAATPFSIGGGNDVTSFTPAGLASGVYDGLDPNDFDNWGYSYHDVFTIDPESLFVPFEIGDLGIVTIARNSTYGFTLTKTDGLVDPNDCIIPGNEITYTLEWSRDPNADNDPNLTNDPNEIYLIDYLPEEVDGDINDPNYYPLTHTYRWNLGIVESGDSGMVQFTVTVNEQAVPKSTLINRAYLTNYEGNLAYAKEETPVCCWGGNIIYVNKYATSTYETGVDWANAYTKLEDALARANGTDEVSGCGREIWVAQGIYTPDTGVLYDYFKLLDGVEMYGGFLGWEENREERNPLVNKTYLYNDNVSTVISITGADDPNDTVMDGFMVSGGSTGISCSNCDEQTTVSHCTVTGTGTGMGISASSSDLNIIDCLIKENGNGINLYEGGEPFIDRCQIYDNSGSGVAVSLSSPAILNCVIHNNGGDGVYLEDADETIIRNDTLVYNGELGVNWHEGSAEPDVANCILWGNNENNGGVQYIGCSPTYSCIDPNDPNDATDVPDPIYHNITANPNFISAENYNFHLAYDSPCKDKGNRNLVGLDELDMDGFDRIYEPNVDMGADEVDCEDVYHPLDWNADGIINMKEIPKFAAAWLSVDPNYYDPNNYDPNYHSSGWDPECDIAGVNHTVDIEDLVSLADEWLWWACWWDEEAMMGMMMMAPSGGGMELSAGSWSAKAVPVEEEAVPMATLEEMTAWLEEIYGDNEEFQLGYTQQEWQEFIDEVKATWYETY